MVRAERTIPCCCQGNSVAKSATHQRERPAEVSDGLIKDVIREGGGEVETEQKD